jgi:hypothetical protein
MRAGLRWKTVLLAGGLWLMPAAAIAQEAPPATNNTPASDAIGPKELQNFSLPGTTTRPVDQAPAAPVASPPTRRTPPASTADTAQAPAPRTATQRPAPRQPTVVATAPAATTQAPPPSLASTPPVIDQPAATPAQQTAFSPPPASQPVEPAGALAPQHKLAILPWLAAALALAAGTIFLLWRRRPRHAYAGGAQFDLFVPPEPAPAPPPQPRATPAPRPEPAPQPAPAPKSAASVTSGIVASRLRPSLEIGVQPLRCVVGDDQVTIEFEIDLFNAGTAPARAVLAEATLFNAGANQEQEIGAFFANPQGAGNRLEAIPPMRHVTLTSQVVAPRSAIHEYELAGRKSFVPVIAFNALYLWSGGHAQTSAAYLVGCDTGGEKLGPLRLDRGPCEVHGLGARPMPTAVRT